MYKPKIFIGSSFENIELAFALQKLMEHNSEPTVWSQGVFRLSQSNLSSLIEALDLNEFAIFIFSPDDILTMREESMSVVRDNVIFELGLFIGRYGPKRCFIVVPRKHDNLHLPSDILGVNPATYDENRINENPEAALGPAAYDIIWSIKKVIQTQNNKKL